MKKIAAAFLLTLAAPAAAQSIGPAAEPRFTVAEMGQSFFTLDEAVDAIGQGRGTILIDPGTYQECAVQEAGSITYRARQPGSVILDTVVCEQKAALVLRGRSARVEGIVFQGFQVPDGNGAGIRIERGDLTVVNSLFRNAESGILSSDDGRSSIRIEQSTFSGLGRCGGENSCAHSIYVNGYGALSIVASRFERGTGGHYVKSRTPRVEILDSSFDDSAGRETNYMIDLPNGAVGTIARNTFVQGENKENYSAFIAIAAEGRDNSSNGLVIAANAADLVPGLYRRTAFVADTSGASLRIGDNRLGQQISEFERRQ